MREQNVLNVFSDGAETAPDVDPECPRDPDDSHEWAQLDRWAECTVCGVRDYWAGASEPCAKPKKGTKPEKTLTLALACARLRSDVDAFEWWWESKDLGDERPALAEWAAEFMEWRRIGSANY